MSRGMVMVFGRRFRDLNGVAVFQRSVFLDESRNSPGALCLSEPAPERKNSVDGFLSSGAEYDGDVSPDALLIPA
jgi:hypothetical protein